MVYANRQSLKKAENVKISDEIMTNFIIEKLCSFNLIFF